MAVAVVCIANVVVVVLAVAVTIVIVVTVVVVVCKKTIHFIFFAVGLGTAWIMASQSSTQTRIQNLTKSYLYLWICQALSCFRRYGPIAYRAVVAVAGCAPDPDLKAQVSSFFVLEFRGHRNREKGIKKVQKICNLDGQLTRTGEDCDEPAVVRPHHRQPRGTTGNSKGKVGRM